MLVTRDQDGLAQTITLRRTSNFHAHLRRDALMRAIAKDIMRHVKYLLVMPNSGPIRTIEDALVHHDELVRLAAREAILQVIFVMTLYHTSSITEEVVDRIAESAVVHAVKHYPPLAGVTTGSGYGIPLDDQLTKRMLRQMAERQVPFLVHGEDVFDKHGKRLDPRNGEAHFIREKAWRLRDENPNLRICIEHGSTIAAVEFVDADTSGNTFMTVTPQASFCNDEVFSRSWSNNAKCKPVIQDEENRAAIEAFMTSGDKRVGAGDDTAAHLRGAKNRSFEEAPNGAFWTWHGITTYAAVFERASALDHRFEDFMSLNAPAWWGFSPPAENDTITLCREIERDLPDPIRVPEEDDVVVPFGWTESSDRLHIGWAIK